jgi:metallo-beta-lactamase class B
MNRPATKQGLRPACFIAKFGTTKEAAEKRERSSEFDRLGAAGAKARIDFGAFAARLKSCPFYKTSPDQNFSATCKVVPCYRAPLAASFFAPCKVVRFQSMVSAKLAVVLFCILMGQRLNAANLAEWTQSFPPFHIAGNLYYVGSADLAAYLITTPDGNILINSNLQSSPRQIEESIEKLGFHLRDTKILLISHAHFDHCAGSAQMLKMTGAKYYVMDADVPVVEAGGRNDFHYAQRKEFWFPRAHVDRTLHDGDTVRLGGTVLTAHKTAGHTKGTTTWTLDESEGGKVLHVVIVGSPNVNPGYKLVGNSAYPQIAEDYRREFQVLKALPCDIFLGAHGGYFGMKEKYDRWKAGDGNAFVDPAGYKAYVADREQAFEAEYKKQLSAGH